MQRAVSQARSQLRRLTARRGQRVQLSQRDSVIHCQLPAACCQLLRGECELGAARDGFEVLQHLATVGNGLIAQRFSRWAVAERQGALRVRFAPGAGPLHPGAEALEAQRAAVAVRAALHCPSYFVPKRSTSPSA